MSLLLEFLKNFLFEIIFVLIFSSGAVALYLKKIRNMVNLKTVGINYIHKYGKDVKNMIKAIKESREIKMISFMPYSFIFDHKELLVQKVKDGCKIKLLVCNPNSILLKELCQIERRVDNDISMQYNLLINMLNCIKEDAGRDSTGNIEVRIYNTEIRNPATICIDRENNKSAFLSVSLPPKRSIDTFMMEFKGDNCDSINNYFEVIWNRHSDDITYQY